MSYVYHDDIKAKSVSFGGMRNLSDIKYLVYHYTGNKTDTARANALFFKNTNTRAAGAHYFVDDTDVYQSIDDKYIAWSVGGSKYSNCAVTGGGKMYNIIKNKNSISIEMCSSGGSISQKTIINAINLGISIIKKYNIPIDNVYRHFDVVGKPCPGWNGWYGKNDVLWQNFKQSIKDKINVTTPPLSRNELEKIGIIHANNFTGFDNENIQKAKCRVLQTGLNLDYKSNLVVDGIFADKSKKALSNRSIKYGDKSYLVTAAEILFYLNNLDPNGLELPGIYGNGIKKITKDTFGGDGNLINYNLFLKLLE